MSLQGPANVFVIHHSPANGRYEYDYDPRDARAAVKHWLRQERGTWNAGNCYRKMQPGDLVLFKMGGPGLKQEPGVYFGGWIEELARRRGNRWSLVIRFGERLTRHLAASPILASELSRIVPRAFGAGIQHVKPEGLRALRRLLPVGLWSESSSARAAGEVRTKRAIEREFARLEKESDPNTFEEGAVTEVRLTRYERDPRARRACLERWACVCAVCGFDFEKRYGKIGEGFIHVHHLHELASVGKRIVVDPEKDLRPVCPNCDAMLHRQRPALSIAALKRRLR